jgi:hypothetical protein
MDTRVKPAYDDLLRCDRLCFFPLKPQIGLPAYGIDAVSPPLPESPVR